MPRHERVDREGQEKEDEKRKEIEEAQNKGEQKRDAEEPEKLPVETEELRPIIITGSNAGVVAVSSPEARVEEPPSAWLPLAVGQHTHPSPWGLRPNLCREEEEMRRTKVSAIAGRKAARSEVEEMACGGRQGPSRSSAAVRISPTTSSNRFHDKFVSAVYELSRLVSFKTFDISEVSCSHRKFLELRSKDSRKEARSNKKQAERSKGQRRRLQKAGKKQKGKKAKMDYQAAQFSSQLYQVLPEDL